MFWIFPALASHFFWALVNIGDKYIVGNRVKNPYVYLMWLNMIGIVTLLLIPFVDFYVPEPRFLLWIALAGALWFFGGLPYIRAVQIEEVTRINIWWNLIPVFALLIEFFVVGKRFAAFELLAFAILVSGAFLASLHAGKRTIVLSKAFPLMIVSTAAFAAYAVIFSDVLQSAPFVVAFIWVHSMAFVSSFSLLAFRSVRRDFLTELRALTAGMRVAVFVQALLDSTGVFFSQWALSLASAALVFSLEGSQVIFVFTMASLISVFAPKFLKEELDFRNVMLKFAAIALMVIGVGLLALG